MSLNRRALGQVRIQGAVPKAFIANGMSLKQGAVPKAFKANGMSLKQGAVPKLRYEERKSIEKTTSGRESL